MKDLFSPGQILLYTKELNERQKRPSIYAVLVTEKIDDGRFMGFLVAKNEYTRIELEELHQWSTEFQGWIALTHNNVEEFKVFVTRVGFYKLTRMINAYKRIAELNIPKKKAGEIYFLENIDRDQTDKPYLAAVRVDENQEDPRRFMATAIARNGNPDKYPFLGVTINFDVLDDDLQKNIWAKNESSHQETIDGLFEFTGQGSPSKPIEIDWYDVNWDGVSGKILASVIGFPKDGNWPQEFIAIRELDGRTQRSTFQLSSEPATAGSKKYVKVNVGVFGGRGISITVIDDTQ